MGGERREVTVWQERIANEVRALVAKHRKEYGITAVDAFDALGDVAEELSLETDNTRTDDEK